MEINKLTQEVYKNAVDKGFYDGLIVNMAEKLALIHSEVSEALEADRKDRYANQTLMVSLNKIEDDKQFQTAFKVQAKDTFEDELADIIIRVMDLAGYKGIDLEQHIKAKMRYNSMREYKHGKKY